MDWALKIRCNLYARGKVIIRLKSYTDERYTSFAISMKKNDIGK